MLRRVAVLASESEVASPDEFGAARRVARRLVETGASVVGTGHGLGPAGTVGQAALEAGGRVIGVVLEGRPRESLLPGLTETHRVADPTGQWDQLLELVDAVLALPGAFAGLEQVLALRERPAAREVPIGLLDEGGYYSSLLGTAGDDAMDRFVRQSQRGALSLTRDLDDLLARLAEYRPPETRRAHASAED